MGVVMGVTAGDEGIGSSLRFAIKVEAWGERVRYVL
jgi:hypothetical protein